MSALEEIPVAPADADLSALSFWQRSAEDRDAAFARLRRDTPVSWHRPADRTLMPAEENDRGYWAVVRHADVRAVSRDARTFRSAEVGFDEVPVALRDAVRSFLADDATRHRTVKGLVNAAFAPPRLALVERQIGVHVRRIVDELEEAGECDFVERAAARLPTMIVEEIAGPDGAAAQSPDIAGLADAALELARHRATHPGEDLMSALALARVGEARLSPEESAAYFVLLAIAGNDSTRHAISHALDALTRFPDQRRTLIDALRARSDTAVEEFVRWATPVMAFRRTAARDTEIAGQPIAEGDRIRLFYISANRDERAFDHPERFNVLRSPNPHVGFGGGGPHYCLGVWLARTRLRLLFTELLTRVPRIEAGEPELTTGKFINGIGRMWCRCRP